MSVFYDDGRTRLDEAGITLRRYYPWGAKRIAYRDIESVRRRPMGPLTGRWRFWGSGDLVHWWPLDTGRPQRREAFEIDTGHHFIATFTPQDPEVVSRILAEQAL